MNTVYLVKVEVDPEAEREWNDWNTVHHIPEVLAEPGFVRAWKYRVEKPAGARPEYWTLYEVSSREALEGYLSGEAVKRLRADHESRFGKVTSVSRTILLPAAAVAK